MAVWSSKVREPYAIQKLLTIVELGCAITAGQDLRKIATFEKRDFQYGAPNECKACLGAMTTFLVEARKKKTDMLTLGSAGWSC